MTDTVRQFFGTDGVRGRVGDDKITPERIMRLGFAVGRVLSRHHCAGNGCILIGKDTRISGYLLESALEAGLSSAGMNVCLVGPMPTPAIAYLTRTLSMTAGIVISASHNPYQDNGIKFFSHDGMKLPDEVEIEIEKEMQKPMDIVPALELGKAERMDDAPGRYIEFCKSTFDLGMRLSDMRIVVDCANGAAYHIAPYVFRELGAKVIDIGVEPNGVNINAGCGSVHPEHLQKTVMLTKADLGIAFDGDADRVIFVDNHGDIVDGDELTYIIAKDIFTHLPNLKGGVVGTVMSNLGLELSLRELGIDFVRTKVGDRYIIEELKKRHWILGGESSGHIICWRKLTTGDGIVAALQVLSALLRAEQNLHVAKQGMKKFPQFLLNVPIVEQADTILRHSKVKEATREVEEQLSKTGRVLLRASGTESVIRVMVEGDDMHHVQKAADYIANVVRSVQ